MRCKYFKRIPIKFIQTTISRNGTLIYFIFFSLFAQSSFIIRFVARGEPIYWSVRNFILFGVSIFHIVKSVVGLSFWIITAFDVHESSCRILDQNTSWDNVISKYCRKIDMEFNFFVLSSNSVFFECSNELGLSKGNIYRVMVN